MGMLNPSLGAGKLPPNPFFWGPAGPCMQEGCTSGLLLLSQCTEGPTQAMLGASQTADPTEPCPRALPSCWIPLTLHTVAPPPQGWLQPGSTPWKRAKGSRRRGGGHGDSPPASGCHFSSPCRELAGPPAGTRRPPERSGAAKLRERGPCPAAACTYLKLSPQNDKGSAGDLSLPGRRTGRMGQLLPLGDIGRGQLLLAEGFPQTRSRRGSPLGVVGVLRHLLPHSTATPGKCRPLWLLLLREREGQASVGSAAAIYLPKPGY